MPSIDVILPRELLLKRIIYRATYRGGKEADQIFKSFADQFLKDFSDQDLYDLDNLFQEDDSLIFTWLAEIEDVPELFDTAVLKKLRHHFNSLRY